MLAIKIIENNNTSWCKTYTISAALVRESFDLATFDTKQDALNAFKEMIECFNNKKQVYKFSK